MSAPRTSTSGRTVTLLVLIGLLLIMCACAYVLLLRLGQPPPAIILSASDEEAAAQLEQARQLPVLLTVLLISALFILLFVLGAYLLIRVGRIVARPRTPDGGHHTPYVDAWTNYRLTEEQISAATSEEDRGPRGHRDDADGGPPADEPPDSP